MQPYGTSAPAAQLRRRRPTGTIGWPIVVLEGPGGSGKSVECARFTADERFATAYWVEIGQGNEGTADSLAPLGRFDVLEHRGDYTSIHEQIALARDEARDVYEDGGPASLLVVDSFTPIWDDIKTWTHRRALVGVANAMQPDAPLDVNAALVPGHNLWTEARERYRRLMTLLITWPGPVVLTVQGEWNVTVPEVGPPVHEYALDAHRSLQHDATVRIRLQPGREPMAVKVSSPRGGFDTHLGPYVLPRPLDLGELVFDRLGVDQHQPPRETHALHYDHVPAPVAASRYQHRPNAIGRGDGRPQQPADLPPEVRTFLGDEDWLSLMEDRRGDVDRLLKLWNAAKAVGANAALLHRIAIAGKEAREAAEARAAEQPAADEPDAAAPRAVRPDTAEPDQAEPEHEEHVDPDAVDAVQEDHWAADAADQETIDERGGDA